MGYCANDYLTCFMLG